MKITVDFSEEAVQKYLDEHLNQVLVNEIARISRGDLHNIIMEAVRSHAGEEVVKNVLPASGVIKQMVETEVRRQARKIICKATGDA